MPGSKRRALKKLLSPSSSPSQKASKSTPAQVPTPSISPTSSLVAVSGDPSIKSVQSAASLNSGRSIATDPQNYLTDQQLHADLEIEAMVEREGQIGTGKAKELDGVGSLSLEDTNLPPEVTSQPQPTAQPPKPSSSPGGGIFGANIAAGFGLGPGGNGGKKKSSRQKFEERQVGGLFIMAVLHRHRVPSTDLSDAKEGGLDQLGAAIRSGVDSSA
jgi:OTU domain-containing protein 6